MERADGGPASPPDEATVAYAEARTAQISEIGTALLLLAVWGWLWFTAAGFPENSRQYPQLLVGSLILITLFYLALSVVRLLRVLRASGMIDQPWFGRVAAPDGTAYHPMKVRSLALFVLASTGYVVAVPYVGYLAATTVFVVVGISVNLGWTFRRTLYLTASCIIAYLAASHLLGVRFPTSQLF